MRRITNGYRNRINRAGGYLGRCGNAVSQLINVLIGGEHPGESLSGRAWRLRTRRGWGVTMLIIDFAFSPFEQSHCHAAYVADLWRARALVNDAAGRRFDIL